MALLWLLIVSMRKKNVSKKSLNASDVKGGDLQDQLQ